MSNLSCYSDHGRSEGRDEGRGQGVTPRENVTMYRNGARRGKGMYLMLVFINERVNQSTDKSNAKTLEKIHVIRWSTRTTKINQWKSLIIICLPFFKTTDKEFPFPVIP